MLTLQARRSVETAKGSGVWQPASQELRWDAAKTALVICDMWNEHWCKGATERVAEMAPRMNEVVKAARAKGVFIIHAPSDTMEFYKDTPQRQRAQRAPAAQPPVELKRWCHLDPTKEAPLPIDDADGGCDDLPQCKGGSPWKRQIAMIDIAEGDAITDSAEAYNLMQERGIENVIVMGVHANMCVLGRPFSIRQMVGVGKNVVLMRDMTDTMYNSRQKPFVSHFRGTDLVVDHIEKYWCASITSADFVGGAPFKFSKDARPRVAFMIGEDEYKTWDTLPEFAAKELAPRGLDPVVIHSSASNKDDFPGLEAIRTADLLVLSVRRRGLSQDQMKLLREYLAAGKPLVAIRTTSHAFEPRPPKPERAAWPEFDDEILGGDYQGHYGAGPVTVVEPNPDAANHPILRGVPHEGLRFTSSLYKYPKMGGAITVLWRGKLEDGSTPAAPVAWVNSARPGRVFYTSLGSPEDFANPAFRALLVNACLWGLNLPVVGEARAAGDQPGPLTPEESLKRFQVVDGLEIEQVLAEPDVRQPVHLSWDERGRLWVVNYIQYPAPAGITLLSKDQFWRAVYDKVPPPPPHHYRGEDKVTIHEDTNGDGLPDRHKVFVDGLNIVTAVAHGRGGVWILNPPYLLFYPDQNRDDVPDGDPVVHLAGFGLEDTHSVANSLRWGPDGWLYGAHGSTVTAHIVRPGLDQEPVAHMMGQGIWRYHPESRRFEVFAEGGGNAFGLELDDQARVFSGHNGGNTRGFHYVQGGYLQKGFEKHGPLSNPYAFGYFRPMGHSEVERFTHTFIIYGGGIMPSGFNGRLFGIEPLQGRVVMSDVMREGSSFKTKDIGYAVTTTDKYFKPVDIKLGPDGAIYIADWYDRQVTHIRNYEGQIDKSNGRVYRLKPKGKPLRRAPNLARVPVERLIEILQHPNRTIRQSALRMLADKRDASLGGILKSICLEEEGRVRLEALWALNLSGGLDDATALQFLDHPDPAVRAWTVRLKGDNAPVTHALAEKMARLAQTESNVEVRGQLASTARRLPVTQMLPVVKALSARAEDVSDIYQPLLLWWAIESKAASDRDALLALFEDRTMWGWPLVENVLIERLMRRWALAGSQAELLACARLLELAPSAPAKARLLAGFNEAYKGRPMTGLPEALQQALAASGGERLAWRLRAADRDALSKAFALLEDALATRESKLEIVEVLGEVRSEGAVAALMKVANAGDKALAQAALGALALYDDSSIPGGVLSGWPGRPPEARNAILNLIATRPAWLPQLIEAVAAGRVEAKSVSAEVVEKLRGAPHLADAVNKHWPPKAAPTSADQAGKIAQYKQLVLTGSGNPFAGYPHFQMACAGCHKLFGEGGQAGPDLTSFDRQDLENMLLNIVDPSAQIREGYEQVYVETKDGRSLSGLIAEKNDQMLSLRGADGRLTLLPQGEVESLQGARTSLMPEGLLEGFDEQQVRDLFAYLRSTQPLVRPR